MEDREPKKVYKHCLLCGGDLIDKGEHLECVACSYHVFVNPAACNAVILENDKGEIMLVKRRVDPRKGFWDLPGGFIQPDEDLDESAKREIREELGIEIEVTDFIGAYSDKYLYQNVLVPTIGMVVSAKIKEGTLKASDDITEFRFFSKEEVLNQQLAFKSNLETLRDYLKRA